MDRIMIEGVRCFHNLQTAPLKPITLLVGENSSGKSTFLAMIRVAWDIALGNPQSADFNEEPFLLGAYDQIANYRAGKAGRVKRVSVGSEFSLLPSERLPNLTQDQIQITGIFEEENGQAVLREWNFVADPYRIEIKFNEVGPVADSVITTPSGSRKLRGPIPLGLGISYLMLFTLPNFTREVFVEPSGEILNDRATDSELEVLQELADSARRTTYKQRPFAFAPIRTSPQRTYDPVKDLPRPEGSHVPMALAKIAYSDSAEWQNLREKLDSFGEASGLFSDVDVRRKGVKSSDPFQILVKTVGPGFNLIDVGYGVSQVLPIIVDTFQGESGSTYLLQQPEVHLHPKAQAALGSFLGELAVQQRKRFVIETHSDYLVDRIRMDVRDGHLSPDQVSLLYFESQKDGAQIHSLQLDEEGNIVDIPPGYRSFFLEEARHFMVG